MRRLLGSLKRQASIRLFWTPQERRHLLVGPHDQWQQKRAFQIEFLRGRGLLPEHRLLDLGCGTLRGGVPLIEYLEVGHYTGLESRAEVLDEGRKELAELGLAHKEPVLQVSERASRAGISTRFDFVWAFSVLIHMTDEILRDTLGFVGQHLAPDGVFYANVNVGEPAEGAWQGFPVVRRPLDFYGTACSENGLQLSDLGPLGQLGQLGHASGVAGQDAQRMLEIRGS